MIRKNLVTILILFFIIPSCSSEFVTPCSDSEYLEFECGTERFEIEGVLVDEMVGFYLSDEIVEPAEKLRVAIALALRTSSVLRVGGDDPREVYSLIEKVLQNYSLTSRLHILYWASEKDFEMLKGSLESQKIKLYHAPRKHKAMRPEEATRLEQNK